MNLEINPSNSLQLHTPMSHCKKNFLIGKTFLPPESRCWRSSWQTARLPWFCRRELQIPIFRIVHSLQ